MDLQDFKAFTEASEAVAKPLKRIIGWLVAVLILFIVLFSGVFFFFMYKAFDADVSSIAAEQTVLGNGSIASQNAGG